MQVIPIQDVYSQTLNVTVGGQNTQLNIYQNSYGLFCDVLLNNVPVISGVICHDRNLTVRDIYLGYVGDFCFMDTQATNDPSSPGLGSRYQLFYLDSFDLAPGQG